MKRVLKKIFINKFSEILLIIFVAGFSLDLLAFPLMSASSSIKNIAGGAILVFFVMFIVMYASEMLSDGKKESDDSEDLGETELDYIPKDQATKKKKNTKQFPEIKSDEPFVKTRNKAKK
jgi:hypothetical protein